MDKIDFKTELKHLYQPGSRDFVFVDVPAMNFVMVDGEGDPNTTESYRVAVEWLYSVSYAMKFASKDLGRTISCHRWKACGGPIIPVIFSPATRRTGTGP